MSLKKMKGSINTLISYGGAKWRLMQQAILEKDIISQFASHKVHIPIYLAEVFKPQLSLRSLNINKFCVMAHVRPPTHSQRLIKPTSKLSFLGWGL